MSYSLVGKFLTKDLKETTFTNLDFDRLKIVNEQRYSVMLKGIEGFSSSNNDGITTVCYKKQAFENRLEQLKLKHIETDKTLERLNNIRFSADFYNMTSEGKDKFESDVSYYKEELDELEYQILALIYTIDIFEFVSSILDDYNLILSISAL